MPLMTAARKPPYRDTVWMEQIPDEQWALYRTVIDAAADRRVPFLLAGGFGLAAYTGRWRNTKDIDLLVLPRDRDAMVEILSDLGFEDYYDQLPYEQHWIYRGIRDDVIVDVIWQMANGRTRVDESWFEHRPRSASAGGSSASCPRRRWSG